MTTTANRVYVSAADTAKAVRKALVAAFPGFKFGSIRSKSYAGGASITVGWEDGPSVGEVDAVVDFFKGARFDGMTDMKSSRPAVEYEGQMVRWGADYIFTSRSHSAAFFHEIVDKICADFGVTKPPISEGDNPWFEYDEAIAQEWREKFQCLPDRRFRQEAESWSKFIAPATATPGPVAAVAGVVINQNHAKNGIEITFPGKPDEGERSALRGQGFRPAKRDGQWYWYAKFSDDCWKFAQSLAAVDAPQPEDTVLSLAASGNHQPQNGNQVTRTALSTVNLGSLHTAKKLRKAAEGWQKRIDFCFADRLTNTHKRAREAEHFRKEGASLRICQDLALKLAERHEAGTIPGFMTGIYAKTQLEWLAPKAQFFNLAKADVERMGGESHKAWGEEDSLIVFNNSNWQKERERLAGIRVYDAAQLNKVLGELQAMIGVESEADKRSRQLAELERGLEFAKIPGFFQTPPSAVQQMIDRAYIEPGHLVLEPSAGNGCIADAITAIDGVTLHCCEVNYRLRGILEHKGYAVVEHEFMEYAANTSEEYDRILMNPPFENEQDIQHVMSAFMLLKPGGILVAIVGEGAFFREKGEAPAFRELLEKVCIHEEKLPSGTFKMTGAASRMITLKSPE